MHKVSSKWRRAKRRFMANAYYLHRPFMRFLPLLTLLGIILIAGGFAFQHLYQRESLSFARALYITYCLVFMEHLIPFPEHWLLRTFYYVVPLIGLVVILDGFVRFGYRVLRRDEGAAEWIQAMAKTYKNHVVLCGLGRVGLRVLQQLLRLDQEVVVLEKNPDNANIAFARRHQVPVLIGTGREEGVMEELNVLAAKSIILATDDDLANLEMALDARRIKPGIRVVLRMFDQELASKVKDAFNINLAFSTASLAAPLFATSSSDRSIDNAFYVGDRLLVVARLYVRTESQLVGKAIRDIGAEHRVFVLAHARGSQEVHFPPADTLFEPGDRLTVQTEPQTLRLLHRWNASEDL